MSNNILHQYKNLEVCLAINFSIIFIHFIYSYTINLTLILPDVFSKCVRLHTNAMLKSIKGYRLYFLPIFLLKFPGIKIYCFL